LAFLPDNIRFDGAALSRVFDLDDEEAPGGASSIGHEDAGRACRPACVRHHINPIQDVW